MPIHEKPEVMISDCFAIYLNAFVPGLNIIFGVMHYRKSIFNSILLFDISVILLLEGLCSPALMTFGSSSQFSLSPRPLSYDIYAAVFPYLALDRLGSLSVQADQPYEIIMDIENASHAVGGTLLL